MYVYVCKKVSIYSTLILHRALPDLSMDTWRHNLTQAQNSSETSFSQDQFSKCLQFCMEIQFYKLYLLFSPQCLGFSRIFRKLEVATRVEDK